MLVASAEVWSAVAAIAAALSAAISAWVVLLDRRRQMRARMVASADDGILALHNLGPAVARDVVATIIDDGGHTVTGMRGEDSSDAQHPVLRTAYLAPGGAIRRSVSIGLRQSNTWRITGTVAWSDGRRSQVVDQWSAEVTVRSRRDNW